MRIQKTLCTLLSIAAFGSLMSCGSSEELLHPDRRSPYKKDTRFVDGIFINGGGAEIKTDIATIKTPSPLQSDPKKYKPETVRFLQQKYSELMNVLPEYIRSVKLYTFIEDWYGVRYRMGGNDKSGIDCSAFVKLLYDSVFRIDIVRTSFDQYNAVTYVWQKNKLREGDLVFFRIHGKHITHVGVYLMNSFFVHASSTGVMISSLNEDYWSRRFAGAGYVDVEGKMKIQG